MWVTGQLHPPATLPPGKELPVPIGQEVRWSPDPVWTLWSIEKCLPLDGNRTPAVQPVARRYTGRAISGVPILYRYLIITVAARLAGDVNVPTNCIWDLSLCFEIRIRKAQQHCEAGAVSNSMHWS
jgi:hypothetical protein